MPELRKDPVVDRWVVMARNRADRPGAFLRDESPLNPAGPCPFCEGHESETPGEVFAHRAATTRANQPGWQLRVVPNKFPALRAGGAAEARGEGLFVAQDAVGVHEVVIESPDHRITIGDLGAVRMGHVFSAYRERLCVLREDQRLVQATVFKNVGAAAGASIEHAHSQIMATQFVPSGLAAELSGSLRYFEQHRRCLFCDIAIQERDVGERVVLETDDLLVVCPYAARFPYETWILPKVHASHYETLAPALTTGLGEVVTQIALRLESVLARPAYNYWIHTAPFDTPSLDHYHWHIEMIPRITTQAGFEWGAGGFINTVPPERAAAELRGADPSG